MIYIPAYTVTGQYDGSAIERGLRDLDQQIAKVASSMQKIQPPKMVNADFGAFFKSMDTGGFQQAGTKAGTSFSDGLRKSLTGNMADAGRDAGQMFTNSMAASFGPAGGVFGSLATALGPAGLVAGAALAGAAVIGGAAVSAAKQWESLMAGVSKTTGVAGADLSKLSNTLLELSTKIPVAQADIAKIAATGGTLGISQADLPKFVTDVSMASVGWQMDAESTAQSIAGISNAFHVPISDAQKFGSVINTMADEVGGSEAELANFLVRASGIATTFHESIAATTAFGAVLASINMPMETAATGMQSMMAYAMADPKKMTAWADMMGISVDQLNAKLSQDLYGTLIQSADAIKSVGSETDQQSKRIALWGEGGARVASGLVGMGDKYATALQKANAEMENGTSLLSAFGAQGATLDSKFTRLGNTMNMAFIHLGATALPVIGNVTDAVTELILKLDSIGQSATDAGDYIKTILEPLTKNKQANAILETAILGPASMLGLDTGKIASSALSNTLSIMLLGPMGAFLSGPSGGGEASAAASGSASGATYIEALNSKLQIGIPKSISDAYLASAGLSTKSGSDSGKAFATAFEANLKAGITPVVAEMMASTGTSGKDAFEKYAELAASQTTDSAYGGDVQNTTMFNDLGMKTILSRVSRSNNKLAYAQMFDGAGKALTDQLQYIDWHDSIGKGLSDSVKPIILSIPKYMKSEKDDISQVFADAIKDGIVNSDETKAFKDLLSGLDAQMTAHPIEFEASGLPKIREDIDAVLAGTFKINIDPVTTEADFEVWLQDHASLFEAQYKKTGVMPMRNEQYQRFLFEQTATDEQKKYLRGMDTAATGGAGAASGGLVFSQALLNTAPELQKQKWFIQENGTEFKNLTTHVRNVDGVITAIDDDGKALGPTFVDIETAGRAMNGGFANLSVTVPAANTSLGTFTSSVSTAAQAAAKFAAMGIPTTSISFKESPQYEYYNNSSAYQAGSFFSGAGVSSQYTNLLTKSLTDKMPKLAGGGIVTKGGLAVVGETEKEIVIPYSQIKNLYPESAKVDKASFQYQTNDRYFEDYPYQITPPTSYPWAKYPAAPQVGVTGNVPSAWLSDEQTTGMEYISSEIRALQLASIGKSQVQPWFVSGTQDQPNWWSQAANAISPNVAWSAQKGGNVPKIAEDAKSTSIKSDIALIKDPRSDACIAFVDPSGSLQTTDPFYLARGAANIDTDKALLFDERTQTCIPMLDAPYLKTNDPFYLASGSMNLGGSTASNGKTVISPGKSETTLQSIEKNTSKSAVYLQEQTKYFTALPENGQRTGFFDVSASGDALVTGLSKEGYLATYDPRTDTCEGLSFVAPDPSLKTTDKFYLGLTQNSPYRSSDKAPGYGWSNTAQPMNEADAQLMKIAEQSYQDQQKATKDTAKMVTSLANINDNMALMSANTTGQALVAGVGGAVSDWFSSAGSINGGGAWIGTSGTHIGMNGQIYYGSTAGNGNVSWGGASAVSGGSSSGGFMGWTGSAGGSGITGSGAIQWAEGGIVDRPTVGVFGEAGREAFVPISDRAAGRRILPQVMSELGVRMFASGGFVGKANVSAAIGGTNLYYSPVINGSGLSEAQLKKVLKEEREATLKAVAAKQYSVWKGRG